MTTVEVFGGQSENRQPRRQLEPYEHTIAAVISLLENFHMFRYQFIYLSILYNPDISIFHDSEASQPCPKSASGLTSITSKVTAAWIILATPSPAASAILDRM